MWRSAVLSGTGLVALVLLAVMDKVPWKSQTKPLLPAAQRRLMGSRFPLGEGGVDLSTGHLKMAGRAIGRLPGKVVGVGGYMHAELTKDLGFEAFRTWGSDQLRWALQAAATADALVVAGLDMSRDPKNYTGWENCNDMDSPWWQDEAKRLLEPVVRNKDNPRILWWIVGNELEGPLPLDQQDCVWHRVNWMAQRLKKIDRAHPVGIAIAGCDPSKLARFAAICHDVDILGMNLYGNDHWGITQALHRAGWWKAWALTECGTAAPWQVPETSWHALMEPMTSTKKGQFIFNGLHRCKMDDRCVGFFAFLWGWKWEKTGTWFGLLDTWEAAGGIPSGYLNDVSQPMLDEISPDWAWPMKLRVHLEDVVLLGPNGTQSATLGFHAHHGARVPVELKIVATPDNAQGNIWMNWYVAPETSVNRKSDGNIPEKALDTIPHAVYYCKTGYRGIVQTQLLQPGKYRLYAFARRTRYWDKTVREASASLPFLVGNETTGCVDVRLSHGACYEKVTQAMTRAKRMGVCQWPAAGLLPSSSFEEFQAAFYANHQGCPPPCSMFLPSMYHGTCEGASWKVKYVDNAQASKLLFAKDVKAETTRCQDARYGTDCFWGVRWVLDHGVHESPQSFPELNAWATFPEAQEALYLRAQHGCHRPCKNETAVLARMAK